MTLRHTFATILAFIALADAGLHAAELSAVALQLPMSTSPLMHSPMRAGNGDIVLMESSEDGDDARRMRFSDDGAWLGSVPYVGRGRLLATGHDRFLAIQSSPFQSYCDLQGISANVAMIWRQSSLLRFDDELEQGDCGRFASDTSSRLWFADADWRIGHLRADGSYGIELDLRQFLAPNQTVQTTALTTLRHAEAAVYAFSDVFNATRSELVAFNPGMQVRWRRLLAADAAQQIDVQALHVDANDQLRVVAAARRDGNDPVHLLLSALDTNGQILWSRHHDALPVHSILHSHRFGDDSIGVLYLAPTSAPNTLEYRVAILSSTGEVERAYGSGTSKLWTQRFTEFIELGDGSRWLFTNHHDGSTRTGMVWALDRGGALQPLSIGQQIGALVRDRGDALVFGTALGAQAMRFDGQANSGRVAFAAPSPLAHTPYPIAVSRLQDNGRLLLSEVDEQLWLARYDAQGDLLWRSPTQGRFEYGLQDRPASPLLLTPDQHTCVVTIAPSETGSDYANQVECFSLATGAPQFAHRLPTTGSSKVLLSVGDDGIEVLFNDDSENTRHRLIGLTGTTTFERVLPGGEALWIEPGRALVRTFSETRQLIESRRGGNGASIREFEPGSPLRTDRLLAHLGDDEFLFATETSIEGQSATRLRIGRGDTPTAVRWTRDIPGDMRFDEEVAGLGPEWLFVLAYRDNTGTVWLHRVRLSDGSEPFAPIELGTYDTDRIATDLRGDGGLVIASANLGRIEWRAFATDGTAHALKSWRCPGDCTRVAGMKNGGEVAAWTASAFGPSALHALSMSTSARRVPRSDDGAISGVFIATNDTNRGYVIDWLPSVRVLFVARFAGDGSQTTTRELLDWETFQGVVPADASEITLPRYRNANGRFGAADDAPTSLIGSARFRFDGCDEAELILTDTRGTLPETETVHLQRSGPRLKPCQLLDGSTIAAQSTLPARGGFDARQSGAWVAAGASDQGLLAAVLPATASANGVFFAPWFTYWTEPGANTGTANRHWLTLQGTLTPASNGSVALTIYRATAGSHGAVRPSNTYRVGVATWTVVDCERATLAYQFDQGEHAAPYSGRQGLLNFSRPGACNGGP